MDQNAQKTKGIELITNSVAKTIEKFCQIKNINESRIDFDLLNYNTVLVYPDGQETVHAGGEIEPLAWRDEQVTIRQRYNIFLRYSNPDEELKLNAKITWNKFLTSVTAIIHPSSTFKASVSLEKKIEYELNKQKLKAGLLIGLCDDIMKRDITEFCKQLRVSGELEQRAMMDLFHAPPFAQSRDDALEFSYKNNTTEKQNGYQVKIGDSLIVYKKAKVGRTTRNAKGQILKPNPYKISKKCDYVAGKGVEIIENKREKIYKATINGFVLWDNKEIYISQRGYHR